MKALSRLLLLATVSAAPEVFAVDFTKEVQPFLREKCFKCHSGPRAKNGVRFDDTATLAKFIGTHEDAKIIPGKPDESRIIFLASKRRDDPDAMPPTGRGEGLSPGELTLLRNWITEGAKLEGGEAAPAPAPTPDQPPKLLTWTNIEGRQLQAYFVRLDGSSVVLKTDERGEFPYPMSQLSADSRKQATDLAKAP
ncbi:MAG: hypothetical protein JNK37_15505 [Verrucomicrobiales bacterium]|nr:hypothetical protein [Verrucomicrobiales bacterium]